MLGDGNKVDKVLTSVPIRPCANGRRVRHLRAPKCLADERQLQDLRWLALTAMAAAAVRFSTPSLA
jgi:hypothetical protein